MRVFEPWLSIAPAAVLLQSDEDFASCDEWEPWWCLPFVPGGAGAPSTGPGIGPADET